MTLDNFSNSFDVLLNSYAREASFGEGSTRVSIQLDEYEKSVFLTKAQERLVISLYNGKNPLGEGFEQTEELRRYLSNLVVEDELDPISTTNNLPLGVNSSSKFFTLPDGTTEGKPAVWFITYEAVTIENDKCPSMTSIEVVPVRQDEYHKIKKNPFRGANARRALRLDLSDDVVEIVCNYTVTKYYIRYIRKVKPIILIDLSSDNLEINGETDTTECELHEALHQKILEDAVIMALQSRGIVSNNINNENN